MLIKLTSAAIQGIGALPVWIEVHTSRGIRFSLVGLPDNAVRESYERIRSALQLNGMDIPRKQVVINMAPADLRKEGTGYDLPLSVGVMAAGGFIPEDSLEDSLFIGELSLDGSLQAVRGCLPIAVMCKDLGIRKLYLPKQNAAEAAVVDTVEVYGISHLKELSDHLNGKQVIAPEPAQGKDLLQEAKRCPNNFADVKGQEQVKRAIEVACSGGHNLIMIGPPGAGKTMMAKCIPGILPPMSLDESLETTKIHSVAGKTDTHHALVQVRPFRSPHHTISSVAMIGGGTNPQPGEISLAHNGVLYLDELPEFNRSVLEVLRQPLEDRNIHISRAKYAVEYPAYFMLVASMNPCPCGFYNHPHKPCLCSSNQVQKYLNRISGPMLDRIDIHCEIQPLSFEELSRAKTSESSESIRERVIRARQRQAERYRNEVHIHCNAQMTESLIKRYACVDEAGLQMLRTAMERLSLSARAYSRILKVARTIADLDNSDQIGIGHIAEAIGYRNLDRNDWASR